MFLLPKIICLSPKSETQYFDNVDKNEIDFVVINSNEVEYYQVALTVLDENTLKRKLATFKNIKDNYPKYLITLDDVLPNTDYEGIKVINALEWLLGEQVKP